MMPLVVSSKRKLAMRFHWDSDMMAWYAEAEFDPGFGQNIFTFVGPNARTQRSARRRLLKQMFETRYW
jgi:hypothetical protein